jgi:hypothetical protein
MLSKSKLVIHLLHVFSSPVFLCGSIAILYWSKEAWQGETQVSDSSIATLDSQKACNNLFDHLNPGWFPSYAGFLLEIAPIFPTKSTTTAALLPFKDKIETLRCSSSEPTRAKDNSIEIVDVVSITKCIGNSQ